MGAAIDRHRWGRWLKAQLPQLPVRVILTNEVIRESSCLDGCGAKGAACRFLPGTGLLASGTISINLEDELAARCWGPILAF